MLSATDHRRVSLLSLAVLAGALLGCDKSEPSKAQASEKPAAAAPQPKPLLPPAPLRRKVAGRVVAIGDVHGDFDATREVLRLAGAIDGEDDWVGGNLSVVQTGDQLDRGDGEREILDLFERLEKSAEKSGGAFVALNGNHEVMNVAGDFRYVTPGGYQDFAGVGLTAPSAAGRLGRLAPDMRGRAAAFFPGGNYAKKLAEHNVVQIVGDSLFVHGGVLPEHVKYGLDRINAEVAAWMRGDVPRPPSIVEGDSAPVWSRAVSDGAPSEAACAAARQVLKELNVKRMVVGHTVQEQGANSACGGSVWRIDVGIAKAYKRRIQAIEIAGGEVKVLSAE